MTQQRVMRAHNPKVAGSNPAPAIPIKALETTTSRAFGFCFLLLKVPKTPFWLHFGSTLTYNLLIIREIDWSR